MPRFNFFVCIFYFAEQEVAGKVSLKHIYEIATIKSVDIEWDNVPMKDICQTIIKNAHTMGIEVVKDLDADSYKQFLEERKQIVEEQQRQLEEARQAKMLRL